LVGVLERFPKPVLDNSFGTKDVRGEKGPAQRSVQFLFLNGEVGPLDHRKLDEPSVALAELGQDVTAKLEQRSPTRATLSGIKSCKPRFSNTLEPYWSSSKGARAACRSRGGAIGVKRRTMPAAAPVTAAGATSSPCDPVGIVWSPDLVATNARRWEGP